MQMTFRNSVLLSIGYASYAALVLAFLDPFRWLTDEVYSLGVAVSFFTISLTCWVFFYALGEVFSFLKPFKIRLFTGIVAAPLLTGFIIGSYLYETTSFFLFISSFLLLTLLPLAVAILYIVFDELRNKIHIIREPGSEPNANANLRLSSDSGKIILEVPLNRVICFEANDNYVVTHYLNKKDEKVKSMDRISLKKISETLEDLDVSFKRVHKSYLINPNFIQEIRGKSQAYKIALNFMEHEVPVSRNFDISIFQNL